MWNRIMIYCLYKAGDFLWYVPMKTNGTMVTLQTVDFCHFLCNMDSISKWRQKPLFCWVTLQNNRQLQRSWYTLFLVPVLTLKFSPVLASLFCLPPSATVAIWFSMHVSACIFSELCYHSSAFWLQQSYWLSPVYRFCLLHIKLLYEKGKWKTLISFHESKAYHLPRWWVILNCYFWGAQFTVWLLGNAADNSL